MDSDLKQAARKFSSVYPVMDNAELRKKKGMKIASILREVLQGEKIGVVLDIGCSNALVLDTVVDEIDPGFAVGIDMDTEVAPKPTLKRTMVIGDAMALPFAADSVDVVICNHTYEHVPNPHQMFAEISRVLKPKGIVYFSAMNARWPIEPHYHLPFIHWLPKNMAKVVMGYLGFPSGYLEKPLPTPGLISLVSNVFEIHDYTIKVIAHPDNYNALDIVPLPKLGWIYGLLAKMFYGLLPSYLWVLTKRREPRSTSRLMNADP